MFSGMFDGLYLHDLNAFIKITACSNSTSILTSRAVPCSCFTVESRSGRERQSVVKKQESSKHFIPALLH